MNLRLTEFVRKYHADLALLVIVTIWGLHYIVVKDALSRLSPLTYNAIRFPIGLPFISLPLLRNHNLLRMSRRDTWALFGWAMLGLVGYQVLFVLGLNLTTATNSALLVSTLPAWVAAISVSMGLLIVTRRLIVGVVITLSGVMLIVMSHASGGPSLSSDDLLGSAMLILGVIFSAIYNIKVVSIVERYGAMSVAILAHWFTCLGLVVIGIPELIKLSPSDVPVSVWPNILYSGLLSSVGGYLVWSYALGKLGATRAATYNNLSPLIAALAGILLLGEHATTGLVVGGVVTLVGVVLVRGTGEESGIEEMPLTPVLAAGD
ncbi:MAG: DMT family transporter [Chloroflexi bacterium]|nr:DMT family transporter [Chloroflexota bacterium]